MPYSFIISDENVVDSDGERVMVDGIDLTRFEKNPVCLFMHDRYNKQNGLVIGKWSNLRKEDGQLLGEVDFDEKDDFSKKIKNKVDGGFMKACSPFVRPIVLSDSAEDKLDGQDGYTYLKSMLMEISIVDLPSNENTVRKSLELVPSLKSLMKNFNTGDPESGDPEPNKLNQNEDEMDKEILKALGLDEKASTTEALAKITSLKSAKDKAEKSLKAINDSKADQLVERGVTKGLIEDDKEAKKSMKDWFSTDLDAAEKFVGKAVSDEGQATDDKSSEKLPDKLKNFLDKVDKKDGEKAAKKLSETSDEELEKMDDEDDEGIRKMFEEAGLIKN